MGRFETKWLSRPENLAALADLPGQWIDKVCRRRSPKTIVLDMDSSESPIYDVQEGSAYKDHFACTCYHSLFVFNQFGDVERCALRPGNVHSADGWRAMLEPVIARYRGVVKHLYFRADAAFANPEVYEFLEAEGSWLHDPTTSQSCLAGQDWTLAQAPGWTAASGSAPILRQLPLSGTELEQALARHGQGRMASGRAVPTHRLHRHQPGAVRRGHCRLLQPARYVRAVH
jgi:hypothetical protein